MTRVSGIYTAPILCPPVQQFGQHYIGIALEEKNELLEICEVTPRCCKFHVPPKWWGSASSPVYNYPSYIYVAFIGLGFPEEMMTEVD